MIPVREDDHSSAAPLLLTDAFRGKPPNDEILKSLTKPLVGLEAAAWDVILKRRLGTAEGEQLDVLGRVVGEPRRGRSDALYLSVLKLVIRVRRSQGRTIDLLNVLTLTGFDFSYAESYPAGWRAEIFVLPNGPDIAYWLLKAKAVGTSGTVVYSTVSRITTWTMDSPTFAGVTGNVFASVTNRALGFGLGSCRAA